ncbi:MAG: single-stranded-DNA-specific exonuclease RecJ [Calditrichia bacterium]|jgi:single-stranded-DNA-specific exonuclease|nr:single-stranded-DNA-specific exonuclease RecJ [Calditrichia bacterium]
MFFQWIFKKPASSENILSLQKKTDINPVLAQLLFERNIDSPEKVNEFLHPDLEHLHDPYLMHNMKEAVSRITTALRDGENILIYGDYDVDGITGVSLLYEAIFKLGGKVSFYIPNRITDGYGLSLKGVHLAEKNNVNLIITVDCGITAIEEIEFAKSKGIDIIVSDHHEPADQIPDCHAVLDPKLKDCPYPFKELAGVGVAFKLMQALYDSLGYDLSDLMQFLDLVAIGTAADIVTMLDENRVLVKFGLERINTKPRNGIFALLESSSLLGRELDVSLIVFVLAPRINAVGRMSNAKKAVHLLTSSSLQQSRNIARVLETENKMRRNIDETTCREAIVLAKEQIERDDAKILVLAKEGWHPGVIGIVASRIMEKFNRPSILISLRDGVGKGSARSTSNFDIYSALKGVENVLDSFGGHKYAAGLTIQGENIQKLRKHMQKLTDRAISNEDLVPTLEIQSEIFLKELDASFFKWLKMFAPYGPQNMRPVFVSRDVEVVGDVNVVGNNHLKFKVKSDGIVIDAIAFNFAEVRDKMKPSRQHIDAAYVIEENTWNGRTTIQMRIKDINLVS